MSFAVATGASAATTVTIATVNNSDMKVMQGLSSVFEETHPDIKLKWAILDENTLRQRLTVDVATHGGQYDVMTIGLFEAPLWAERGWTTPIKNIPANYDVADLLPSVKDALTYKGELYSLPFYAEARLTFYRKDLFEKAALTMPAIPTYDQIKSFAAKLNDPSHGTYGICMRGKPGDDTVGDVTGVANTYGARWFDMQWRPQLNTAAWHEALTMYTSLLQDYAPPGAPTNGYNENLALFASGKCAIWPDATVSASFLADPSKSAVAGKVGYAHVPYGKFNKGDEVPWIWSLAVPSSSKAPQAAKTFILWATSKEYVRLVAEKDGEANVPSGTRQSTYRNPAYIAAAPFAKQTLSAIEEVNMEDATQEKVPYRGLAFVSIPEWPEINAAFAQDIQAVIAKQMTVDAALADAQKVTERIVRQAGYQKN